MDKIDEIINNLVKSLNYNWASEMFAKVNSGKKLRSKLILKISGESEASLRLCAVIELIHLASLLHDDVIDESALRRGKPSINSIFGTKNAIMLGDILYSKGFNEIVKFDIKIADIISDAVCKLSIGEMMDMKMSNEFNASKEQYLQMIYYKTAALIEASARSSAVLTHLDDENYALYGKNLGLAFQIIDDILDITSDNSKLGKPSMNDFREGKTTLPYIFLYEKLHEHDKMILKGFFKKDLKDEEVIWIKNKFDEFDIVNLSIQYAREFGLKAMQKVANNSLQEIIENMINRDF